MNFTPSHIATLATKAAIDDLILFLKTLSFWNTPTPPTVYIYCDSAVNALIPTLGYSGTIVVKEALNEYTDLNRAEMERMPSNQSRKNLFFDFVCEKLNLLDWVFNTTDSSGVLFCDADIFFLAPLLTIPYGTQLAVSPHLIRSFDEARYGIYNAGMIWIKNSEIVQMWRESCDTSNFYEQIAIENVVSLVGHAYQIPETENYGWWRMWQGRKDYQHLQAEWRMNRTNPGSGITIRGVPLGSVHTHFNEEHDAATVQYNKWVRLCLLRVAKIHEPARKFLEYLGWE